MAEKCVKKCPTSLAISARQIKILLRLYLIPVRMAIKKTNNNKCWQECGRTSNPINCWWECKISPSTMELSMKFSPKLKI
jgi:hypothetical protein